MGWQLIEMARDKQVHLDLICLFGSYAKGQARADSDIDLALVSRDFHSDKFENNVAMNLLASSIDPRIEVITFDIDEYLDVNNPSPILAEIKKYGIPLF